MSPPGACYCCSLLTVYTASHACTSIRDARHIYMLMTACDVYPEANASMSTRVLKSPAAPHHATITSRMSTLKCSFYPHTVSFCPEQHFLLKKGPTTSLHGQRKTKSRKKRCLIGMHLLRSHICLLDHLGKCPNVST